VNSGPPFDGGLNSLNLNGTLAGGNFGGPGSTSVALANAANQLEKAISAGGNLVSSGHPSNSS